MSDDILRQIRQESTDGVAVNPLIFPHWSDFAYQVVTPGYHQPSHRHKHEGMLWHEKALGKATRRANRLWALVQRGVLTDAAYRVAMAEIKQRYRIEVSNG